MKAKNILVASLVIFLLYLLLVNNGIDPVDLLTDMRQEPTVAYKIDTIELAPEPTQTPYIIVITATPEPAPTADAPCEMSTNGCE